MWKNHHIRIFYCDTPIVGDSIELSAVIRTTAAEKSRSLSHWSSVLVYDLCHLCFFPHPFHLHVAFLCLVLKPLFHLLIFFFFCSLQLSVPPRSSLMLPNTQSSFPFLLHHPSISCFVCKPQGREMGEKHSAALSQKTGESSPLMCLSPSSHKKRKKNTHTQKKKKLPAVHLHGGTRWWALRNAQFRVQAHTFHCSYTKLKPRSHVVGITNSVCKWHPQISFWELLWVCSRNLIFSAEWNWVFTKELLTLAYMYI